MDPIGLLYDEHVYDYQLDVEMEQLLLQNNVMIPILIMEIDVVLPVNEKYLHVISHLHRHHEPRHYK